MNTHCYMSQTHFGYFCNLHSYFDGVNSVRLQDSYSSPPAQLRSRSGRRVRSGVDVGLARPARIRLFSSAEESSCIFFGLDRSSFSISNRLV